MCVRCWTIGVELMLVWILSQSTNGNVYDINARVNKDMSTALVHKTLDTPILDHYIPKCNKILKQML